MEFFEESVLIFSNFLKIQDNTGQILQIQDKFGNTGQFLKIQDIQDIQDTLDSLIRSIRNPDCESHGQLMGRD